MRNYGYEVITPLLFSSFRTEILGPFKQVISNRIKSKTKEAVNTGALKVNNLKEYHKIVVKTKITGNNCESEVQSKPSDQIVRSPSRSVV